MNELAFVSASELVERFRRREVSPVEVAEAVLDQIDRYDEAVNAYCFLDPDRTREMAQRSQERYARGEPAGPVDGVPVAIKDIFFTQGWPTRKGSKVMPDTPGEVDAPVVASLRRSGAVFTGKVTTPEFAWKGVTDSPLYGATCNPWDPTKTAGGSSGGSAAAVVLGMATLALGTDGGGSVRIPASFCGHPGLKPTYGRVPVWPASPFGTLAHVGPHARTVRDNALMLSVLAQPDSRDWTAAPPDGTAYEDLLDGGVRGLRVAYTLDLGYVPDLHPGVTAAVAKAATSFTELGAEIVDVDWPLTDPVDPFRVLWNTGAAQATRDLRARDPDAMDPALVEICRDGERYSALDWLQAHGERAEYAIAVNQFFEDYDLLITPTVPIPAFGADLEVPEDWEGGERWWTWTPFTTPFNLSQHPAASVLCGFTGEGLPIGLQIVGPKHADALVLRAAHTFEQARPFLERRPPILDEQAPDRGGTR